MWVTDCCDMTLAVKVVLNLNTTNQPKQVSVFGLHLFFASAKGLNLDLCKIQSFGKELNLKGLCGEKKEGGGWLTILIKYLITCLILVTYLGHVI